MGWEERSGRAVEKLRESAEERKSFASRDVHCASTEGRNNWRLRDMVLMNLRILCQQVSKGIGVCFALWKMRSGRVSYLVVGGLYHTDVGRQAHFLLWTRMHRLGTIMDSSVANFLKF